ncbi:sugar ABC transporter permease [Oceanobacillus oncorhynchi subsp. incaldanensis]|uniref:Maltose/maltodextrin transport system permease protein n=2 Tax=Oceanobacillus TaxID=182709 RepID=A0A0A1MDK3_9BACI|nr:sugar ABC transporter permease [Oceanobacillus oncorhynchi]UUI39196.1 ABC transporter permease subunit [Oceanobacillus oncorhynchi]GIO17927.1 sugar ABC transporter permease [Oceanobacillus oncorhynchi subsp. incaldanensis]CEI81168.1 Maltose transport system permease protein MalF [Oceanobacillus oncorhynchi]
MTTPEKKPKKNFQKHNPAIATILSILFAGLGQLYNRRYIKGAIFIVIEGAFLFAFLEAINYGLWGLRTLGTIPGVDHSIRLLVLGVLSLIVTVIAITLYVFNVLDARKQAQKIKRGWVPLSFKQVIKEVYDYSFPYIITFPGLFLMIFVVIFPLLFSLLLAFTNYDLYHSPPRNLVDWVGLDNFKNLFTVPIWQETFFSVFVWTIVWTVVATTLQIALGFFLAVLVNDERLKFKKLIRTILILPWAVPAFVTILVFAAMFNDDFGAINRDIIIPLFGGDGVAWLSDPLYSRVAIIMVQTWLGFPFIFALFTGILQSISKDWYEAADIDGASRIQKFKNITFPHVMFATAPLLIMQYAQNFNNFNVIYLFNEGGPAVRGQNAGGTDILISWVYKLTFDTNNYSMAAVISIIMGLIVSGFAFYQFRRTRSFKEEGDI